MGEQMEKKFTWVLKNFSSLQQENCYSRPFNVAGCNWHILAYRKGTSNDGYFCVFLELADPESLPSGCRRQVKFSLTLVSKACGKSNKVIEGQCCFNAKHTTWGHNDFVSLKKVCDKRSGFLVNNKLTIVAQLHVLPPIVLPMEPVKIIEPLSIKQRNQSFSKSQGDSPGQVGQKTENASKENLDDDEDGDASEEGSDEDYTSEESFSKYQGDSPGQVGQKTENASKQNLDDDDDGDASEEGSDEDYTSEEASDDDDDTSEEDLDDDGDASSPLSDDGGTDISSLSQSNALEGDSYIVGNHSKRCKSVAAESEVSNGENDDAPKEDVDDEASSHVSNDSAKNGRSLDQVKSLEAASQTVENGGRGLDTVSSITGTSGNVLMEIQPVKETLDVNGFEVFSSQVEWVSHIFKRHPDIAISFRPKNQQIRKAYMNALLSLIEMLCQAPDKLTDNDLSNADETLVDLTDAGFKLDWLKTKLSEIYEKKKTEQGSRARLQTMEEQLQKLKQMFLDLESELQKEKVEALAARAPLSFNDVVC